MDFLEDHKFWQGKRVLITGHTGFKGSWLTLMLSRLDARILGISLKPETCPNLFDLANIAELAENKFVDINDESKLKIILEAWKPQIVFHLAAQSLVPRGYNEPIQTFDTNIIGTAKLLNILRTIKNIMSIVVVTTDKVYENKEWDWPYRENDRLGSNDPYSASKAATELIVKSFRSSFFERNNNTKIATARAGNVVGGGDWSEDRLIPDMIKAITANKPLLVRNLKSTRPWQHVLEPIYSYLILAKKLAEGYKLSSEYNFGPASNANMSVESILMECKKHFPNLSHIDDTKSTSQPREANLLALDVTKSRLELGIEPILNFDETIDYTCEWYKNFIRGYDPKVLCMDQISDFLLKIKQNKN